MPDHVTEQATPQPSTRPNILLICTDQQRFDALAAYDNPEIHTPNLDQLAAQGSSSRTATCRVLSAVPPGPV